MNTEPAAIEIDAAFPGGNILVDRIEESGGEVIAHVRQDRRTTTEWWFYWNLRVRGELAGKAIRFVFGDGNVFAALGPCFSPDRFHWEWLGTGCVDGDSFVHRFAGDDGDEAYFSLGIAYTEEHLRRFLARHPQVQAGTLTTSEKGRTVELLTCSSHTGRFVVPIVARSHACEAAASYVLEGILSFWAADATGEGAFLRENVDFRVVPFLDKDGVEEGDQGKLRHPHDHNRDYRSESLYASTRAFMAHLPTWRGEMRLAFDLHCPWIRGGNNEQVFFVGIPEPWNERLTAFSRIVERTKQSAVPYVAENNFLFGQGWNTGAENSFGDWMRRAYPDTLSATLEFPYANAQGVPVTAEGARAFGQDMARAIAVALRDC